MPGDARQPVTELSDDSLLDELREQVNKARRDGKHDRPRTRAIAEEAQRRGWGHYPAPMKQNS